MIPKPGEFDQSLLIIILHFPSISINPSSFWLTPRVKEADSRDSEYTESRGLPFADLPSSCRSYYGKNRRLTLQYCSSFFWCYPICSRKSKAVRPHRPPLSALLCICTPGTRYLAHKADNVDFGWFGKVGCGWIGQNVGRCTRSQRKGSKYVSSVTFAII